MAIEPTRAAGAIANLAQNGDNAAAAINGNSARDFLKDGRPGRIGDLTDQNIPFLQPADFLHRLDDPRRAFDHAAGRGESPDLVARGVSAGVQPGIKALAGDAPQHHYGWIIDHLRNRPERRGRLVLRPLADSRPALGNDLRPVLRSSWR